MRYRQFIVYLAFLIPGILLSNCTSRILVEQTPAKLTIEQSIGASITKTVDIPTSIITQTAVSPSETPKEGHTAEKLCIPVSEAKSLEDIPGTIVTYDNDSLLSLWTYGVVQKIALGRVSILSGVSTYGQELAYIDEDLHQVNLISYSGEKLTSIPASEHWVEILGWVDNHKLLIGDMPFAPNGGWRPPSITVSLDLVTSEINQISSDFSDIYTNRAGGPFFFAVMAIRPLPMIQPLPRLSIQP